ncbi:hypothetical protein [Lewinella sp. W8]|uniref:hypothetical protein n=1 Tax=Lewinella sp. W8 TaxID=2528208 RepID=UPI001067FE43|nr:hypothetical protein [Lewinella sp. W8]MTB51156.1 hypothetical protein [Lewinella sp. W8]
MLYRRKIHQLVPLLTTYLLVASIGLPLQRIYCACRGEAWLSITAESHACHLDRVPKAIVQKEKKASCCLAAKACHAPTEEAEDVHDCGDTDIVLAQLDVDFLVQDDIKFPGFSGTALLVEQTEDLRGIPPVAPSTPIRGPDPPPRPAGRTLLVAYQTFLI